MPLAVRFQDELFMPVVVCDYCGKDIETANDGNCQWLGTDGPCRLYFTHKACCRAFEHRHGGHWCWMELAALPAYLVTNLGISWRESKRMANFFSRM